MRVRLVRRPGQHGTKAFVEQYGDRLVCVRYRYDEAARRRYKTVEIIVEEGEWEPAALRYEAGQLVGVRLPASRRHLVPKVSEAGGVRREQLDIWAMSFEVAAALGLQRYVVGTVEALAEAWNRRYASRSRL